MSRFITLCSGSSGNSAVVEHDGRYLLVDIGLNGRPTLAALAGLGLRPQGLAGVLITHEHIDHIRGLRVLLKQLPVPLYATAPTLDALWEADAVPDGAHMVEVEGRSHVVEGFGVTAFPTSHDAAGSCGYRIETPGGGVMALATDLGKMTADVFCMMEGAGVVALEANYDPEMLRLGRYPPSLKKRVASVRGHLSNRDSAAAVAQLIGGGCQRIVLCHLSEENNYPHLALKAVEDALLECGLRLQEAGAVRVAPRYEPGEWIEF
ncbi:MAG: MBL fold metallo-hydrolase [Ruminococcaceae bacterium]|nr:MBL fold metallo-hydrolase [Oscillospiraceae bacterium]